MNSTQTETKSEPTDFTTTTGSIGWPAEEKGGGCGQQFLVPLLLLGPPFFCPIILFVSTTLLNWMTDISLHMQWPLTSQLHGTFSQREQDFSLFFFKKLQTNTLALFDLTAHSSSLLGGRRYH
jgi:hypothetical protein